MTSLAGVDELARVVLAEAAALAVGVALDRHVLVTVNGDQIVADPRLPLVAGDTVAFRTAEACELSRAQRRPVSMSEIPDAPSTAKAIA